MMMMMNRNNPKFFAGCIALGVSLVIWIADAEFIQLVQGEENSNQVFLLTFVIRSAQMIFLIPLGILFLYKKQIEKTGAERPTSTLFNAFCSMKMIPSPYHIKLALAFNLFEFVCDLLWNESLKDTDVAVNTAIYNSLPVFVLMCSFIVLKEPVNLKKV
jgi:drug/metabolite transporter (DMT)-like permease